MFSVAGQVSAEIVTSTKNKITELITWSEAEANPS